MLLGEETAQNRSACMHSGRPMFGGGGGGGGGGSVVSSR